LLVQFLKTKISPNDEENDNWNNNINKILFIKPICGINYLEQFLYKS